MIDSTTAFQIDWSGWWVTRVAITGTTKTSVLESYSYNNIRPSVCVQCQSFLCLIVFLCLVMNAVPDVEYKRKLFLMLPWIPCCKFPIFHLLLVTLNYSNMQQKGSDTVTSLNVFEDRYSSLQTKPDAVLLKQQQEDLFQNERSFHAVKLWTERNSKKKFHDLLQ